MPEPDRSSAIIEKMMMDKTASFPVFQAVRISGPNARVWGTVPRATISASPRPMIEAASVPALPVAMTPMTASAGRVQIRYCKVFPFLPSIIERGPARWKSPVLTSASWR